MPSMKRELFRSDLGHEPPAAMRCLSASKGRSMSMLSAQFRMAEVRRLEVTGASAVGERLFDFQSTPSSYRIRLVDSAAEGLPPVIAPCYAGIYLTRFTSTKL